MSNFLENIILELNESQADIQSVFLFSIDGLLLAGSHKNAQQEAQIDEIGITSAAIREIAERSAELLQRGKLEHIHILNKQGSMIVTNVGTELILVVLTQEQANIGMILHQMKFLNQKISSLL